MQKLSILFRNQSTYVVIVSVLLILVAVWQLVATWKSNTNKKIFTELNYDMLSLFSNEETLKPSINKYCVRNQQKFGGGKLRCELDLSFTYLNDDEASSLSLFIDKPSVFEILSTTPLMPTGFGTYSYANDKNIICRLSELVNGDESSTSVSFVCSKYMDRPIF